MENVLRIASLVRQEIEIWASQKSRDFSHFVIDQNNLAGACGISSWMLNRLLKNNKIHSRLVIGYFLQGKKQTGHCWVELMKEQKIVDITATQFAIHEKIFVPHPSKIKNHYQISKFGKSAEHFLIEYWGSQSPRTYDKELKDIYARISKKIS